jgi:hypothetical protein
MYELMRVCWCKKSNVEQKEQDSQCRYNVTLRRVHETIVVVEKQ